MKYLTVIFIILTSFSSFSFSKIIYAPCDSLPTIQDGINTCLPGDTLIIYPGTYYEHLRISKISQGNDNPAGITIGSEFLTSGDRSKINETVIDASGEGSCVRVDRTENTKHRMVGLTLQNGMSMYGGSAAGGVVLDESQLYLSDMRIQDHKSEWLASAVYCMSGSGAYIENSIITNNHGNVLRTALGGGIFLTNAIIINNLGTAMRLSEYSGTHIINSNIANNGGGIRYENGCGTIILNSILWNPDTPEISYGGDPGNLLPASIYISNTCIQEGKNGVIASEQDFIKLLQNIQDDNPLFIDAGGGDYSLEPNSPCIGVGANSVLMAGKMMSAPKKDFFGNDRPSPPLSKIDLGAIEQGLSSFCSDKNKKSEIETFEIYNNYPNPFNGSTNIKFSIDQEQNVEASIIDLNGRVVKKLFNGPMQAGLHIFTWNSQNQPSGIYFIQLQAGDNVRYLKATVLK